ncbi:MAG: O-antigen polymerase [Acidobacteriaceae bacterium]
MDYLLFTIFILIAAYYFYYFIAGKFSKSPLWLMLSAWALALGIPQLKLSDLEKPWSQQFWLLIVISLISFTLGFFVFSWLWKRFPFWTKFKVLTRTEISTIALRVVIYVSVLVSALALYLFYKKAGNFPLLASDTDVFRFQADEQVPGLINYLAQLARIYIPLGFFLMFWQGFKLKKHWDLVLLSLFGTFCLTLFASRTQIFFIDLWVMAMYLFIRKPNLKQALKFYPFFLIVSVLVLAAVPLFRQAKSYGSSSYLANVTAIKVSGQNPASNFFVPIYVGVSFNMQALLHAQQYYEVYPLQHGKVFLAPFTNILGLHQFAPNYDLGEIFYSWWNTGTYLFPFVQDFGNAAFYFVPFLIAGLLTLAWRYWKNSPNFLSINLYAYACFFIVMTIYLSFTVRAEMYIDLFLIFVIYLAVSKKVLAKN